MRCPDCGSTHVHFIDDDQDLLRCEACGWYFGWEGAMLRAHVAGSSMKEEWVDDQLTDEEARARGVVERSRYSRRGMVGTIVKPIYRHIGHLAHRRVYHADGSQTDTYTIELERDAFLEAGGVEVGTVHDQTVVAGTDEVAPFGRAELERAERMLKDRQ